MPIKTAKSKIQMEMAKIKESANTKEMEYNSGNSDMETEEESQIETGDHSSASDFDGDDDMGRFEINLDEDDFGETVLEQPSNDAEEEKEEEEIEEDDEEQEFDINDIQPILNPTPLSALSEKTLKKFMSKQNKSGVVYLSKIPPFMKPIKLRQLLTKYGEVGRIYLVPEDEKISQRRKKYRHNKRINFTEGWVEFTDKNAAKQVATMLNNKQMDVKKSSFYYDDIWNIKYLPRFKWNHLTEQLAYETKVKEQLMKAEISNARRETKAYIHNVEKAKMIESIENKKKRKLQKTNDTSESNYQDEVRNDTQNIRRRFKQRKVIDVEKKASNDSNEKKKKVISQLFA